MNDLIFIGGAMISIFCFVAAGLIVWNVVKMLFCNAVEDARTWTERKNNEL